VCDLDVRPLDSKLIISRPCHVATDHSCQLTSRSVHLFSRHRVLKFTNEQTENIMHPPASLAWWRHNLILRFVPVTLPQAENKLSYDTWLLCWPIWLMWLHTLSTGLTGTSAWWLSFSWRRHILSTS